MFIEQLKAENTPDKAIYEKFSNMCGKIALIANKKTLMKSDDAQFVEKNFGFAFDNRNSDN